MLHEARQIGPEPNDAKGSQSDDVQDLVCLPSVHLRPLCVLVAPGGGVAGVRDVLQEAPPVLQVLDADVAAQVDNESTESTQQCVMVSLSGRDAASVRVTVQTPHHGLPGAAAGDGLRPAEAARGCLPQAGALGGNLLTLGWDKTITFNFILTLNIFNALLHNMCSNIF